MQNNLFTSNERTNLSNEALEAILFLQSNGPSPKIWQAMKYTKEYLKPENNNERCDPGKLTM